MTDMLLKDTAPFAVANGFGHSDKLARSTESAKDKRSPREMVIHWPAYLANIGVLRRLLEVKGAASWCLSVGRLWYSLYSGSSFFLEGLRIESCGLVLGCFECWSKLSPLNSGSWAFFTRSSGAPSLEPRRPGSLLQHPRASDSILVDSAN